MISVSIINITNHCEVKCDTVYFSKPETMLLTIRTIKTRSVQSLNNNNNNNYYYYNKCIIIIIIIVITSIIIIQKSLLNPTGGSP